MPRPPYAQNGPANRAEINTYLDNLADEIAAAQPTALPSLLISGTVRCGKTRVARALAQRTGHVIVETDHIRNALYRGCTEIERRRVMKYSFRKLLMRHPTGILLEGTALTDDPMELPLWAKRRGLDMVIIGYSQGNSWAKARDMQAFRDANRCWTLKTHDAERLRKLARQIRKRSAELRDFCALHGLPYHDLDSGRFYAEVARIAALIETMLQERATAQGAQPGLIARLQFWKTP